MSKGCYSIFERWSWTDFKKLEKFKNAIRNFEKRQNKDTPTIMTQLPRELLTSLHTFKQSEEIRKSLESLKNISISVEPEISFVKDQVTGKIEVSINLDTFSNISMDAIRIEDFEMKILKNPSSQNSDQPKTVDVKVILPKGSSYTLINDENGEEIITSPNKMLKHEDFSTLSEKFVNFANSLVDVGSVDFITGNLTSSSPMPLLNVQDELDFMDLLSELEQKQKENSSSSETLTISTCSSETLNNSVEVPSRNEIKPMDLINNDTSAASLNFYFTALESLNDSMNKFVDSIANDTYMLKDYEDARLSNSSIQSYLDMTEDLEQIKNIALKPILGDCNNCKIQLYNCNSRNIDNCFSCSVHDIRNEKNWRPHTGCAPIMGKTALLAKSNTVKDQHNKSDSKIIEQLVKDRFKAFLTDYNRRSINRKTLPRKGALIYKSEENVEEIAHIESNENTTEISEGTKQVEQYGSNNIPPISEYMTHSITEKQTKKIYVDEGNQSFKGTKQFEIYLSPASSTTTCNSRNFGEFIESGQFGSKFTLQSKTEYDPQQFLVKALGDDFSLSTTSFEDPFHDIHSTYNLHAELVESDHSICTSEMSDLISRPSLCGTSCETRLKRLQSTTNDAIQKEEFDCISHPCTDKTKIKDEHLTSLFRESAAQYQIIQQSSKALNFSKTIKEFQASPEQIEAEKILLIATHQREIILQEIEKVQAEECVAQTKHFGAVKLNNLTFAVCDDAIQKSNPKMNDYNQLFVCIASCGTILFASDAVIPNLDGKLCFNFEISFEQLKPDFEIVLKLYAMKIKNNLRNYSHESKYHLNRHSKTTCPSPTKLLNFRRRTPLRLPDSTLNPSSFILLGSRCLRIGDLGKTSVFGINSMPLCSILSREFSVTLQSSVKIQEYYAGFLHIGNQDKGELISWTRRWCALDGTELKYWNDPCENGTPLHIVDLRCCLNSWISPVDRSFCARPKTLLLEITNDEKQIIKHFLSADTINDMKNWDQALNAVVSSLRMWYCMKSHSAENSDVTVL